MRRRGQAADRELLRAVQELRGGRCRRARNGRRARARRDRSRRSFGVPCRPTVLQRRRCILKGVSTAPFGFLRVAAAAPQLRSPTQPSTSARSWGSPPGRVARRAGPRLPGAGPHRLHRRGPLLQPDDAGRRTPSAPSRGSFARPRSAKAVIVVGLPVAAGQPALQRRGRDAVRDAPGRRPQELPPRLQGVLRGALVLVVARGACGPTCASRARRRPSAPTSSSRVGGGAGRRPRGRDLRGPLGADPAEQPARRRRGDRAPEPVRLDRPRRQGRLPPRAGAAAVGPDDLGLRPRQRGRPRVHDRRRVRRPPAGGRGRRGPRRGRALPPRRPAPRHRRGHRAPAWSSACA